MPASFLCDGTLNLNEQAIGVLKRLKKIRLDQIEGYDPDLCLTLTEYAWYNGPERGVSVVLHRAGESFMTARKSVPRYLTIIFGEDRRTHGIFIEYWHQSSAYFNSPVVGYNPEESFENRLSAPAEEYDRAAALICDLISQWFNGTLPKIEKG